MKKPLVTIDGPAGAGKTTVSREAARRLGYSYVDTGALYRGLAVMAAEKGVGADDQKGLARIMENLTLKFEKDEKGDSRLLANGRDITALLRTNEVSMLASAVSALPAVRQWLLDLQRNLGREGAAVFEGRDMGTVVFPQAGAKFFLTADPSVRARRRHAELVAAGREIAYEKVLADIITRDTNDSTRAVAPLKPAPDAVILDSTDKTVDEVVESILNLVRQKQG
ncbi:MAG: (d)CMP kinase [Desulfatibacillaceae bacterium]|nr:(d)CMP kinase [Desulfatibacillaceae bacterium]